MKNLTLLALVLLLFAGCDKFKDKRYSTTIPFEFQVDITENSGSVDVNIEGVLSSLINDELAAVKESIKEYELVQVRYKIWEYVGDPSASFSGTLGIGHKNSTVPGVTYTFPDISLLANHEDPNLVELTFNSSEIDKIEQYFLDTNGLKLFLEGNSTHAPVSFVLQVIVDVDAIAEEKD